LSGLTVFSDPLGLYSADAFNLLRAHAFRIAAISVRASFDEGDGRFGVARFDGEV
jgi:hypothetical protein